MKCEDVDKLLHLYFDGELDAEKSKEIEEHLLSCQKCAARLQELENLKEGARRIRMPEPSPDYWKTFTERVRNEIILRKRESIWARFKSGWESFFFYSPVKLRIAAGIASVLLVFIIGKLYWDYKGKELEKIRSERMEKVLNSQVQKRIGTPTSVTMESLQVEPETIKPAPSESISGAKEMNAELLAPQESTFKPVKKEVQEEKVKGLVEGKETTLKGVPMVTAERPKIEKGTTANLRTITQAEMAVKPPILPETTLYVQKLPEEKRTGATTTFRAPTIVKKDEGSYPAGIVRYYKVDTNWVRALSEKDTSIEADTLKKVISSWKEYFEKNPESEWTPKGFSQIKIAYELLFLKTSDESLRQEGIKLLNQYSDSLTDQKTKDELAKKIFELEALKKK